jgi:hypothetical protein
MMKQLMRKPNWEMGLILEHMMKQHHWNKFRTTHQPVVVAQLKTMWRKKNRCNQ